MAEENQKPALRISHIVYGREAVGNRVKYLVDPRGLGTEKAIPESIVLKRWRKRQFPKYRFGGTRLSSTFWRAVDSAFPFDANTICNLNEKKITTIIESVRAANNELYLKLPSANCLRAIFSVVKAERLSILISKHTSVEHAGRSGVPDLFLFATREYEPAPSISCFVEVKKPEELLRPDQIIEIKLLNDLGLRARVLRLIERT